MSRLAEQLRDYVERSGEPVAVNEIWSRVDGRARRRRVTTALVVVAALIVGIAGLFVASPWSEGGGRRILVGPEPQEPIFGDRSGVVLVLDDRLSGVMSIDPDHRVVSRRVIEGQHAGDQPFNLTRVGDELVLGWGEIWASPIDGSPSHKFADATIYVPAVEPGRVWTIDYPDGRLNSATEATVRLVGLDGSVVLERTLPVDTAVETGIEGGLVLIQGGQVRLWDATTDSVRGTLEAPEPRAGEASGSRLAWCNLKCTLLHVTDTSTVDVLATQRGPGFDISSARFSPDGSMLAIAGSGEISIVDVAAGGRSIITDSAPRDVELGWSPDGSQLFFAGYSYHQGTTTIGRYRPSDRSVKTATVPAGGVVGSLVVLDSEQSNAFVAPELGAPAGCASPDVYIPDRPPTICSFSF